MPFQNIMVWWNTTSGDSMAGSMEVWNPLKSPLILLYNTQILQRGIVFAL